MRHNLIRPSGEGPCGEYPLGYLWSTNWCSYGQARYSYPSGGPTAKMAIKSTCGRIKPLRLEYYRENPFPWLPINTNVLKETPKFNTEKPKKTLVYQQQNKLLLSFWGFANKSLALILEKRLVIVVVLGFCEQINGSFHASWSKVDCSSGDLGIGHRPEGSKVLRF